MSAKQVKTQAQSQIAQSRSSRSRSTSTSTKANPNLWGPVGAFALAVVAFLGGVVTERKKGLTGQAEAAIQRGQQKIEEEKKEFTRKAKATEQAIKETIYGKTDPDWKVRIENEDGIVLSRMITGKHYEIYQWKGQGANLRINEAIIDGPDENGEWTSITAVKRYVDRITKPKNQKSVGPKTYPHTAIARTNRGQKTKTTSSSTALAPAPTQAQKDLVHEALEAVGQHGQKMEYADSTRYNHMVCVYTDAKEFDEQAENSPGGSLLGAYAAITSPAVLALLKPGCVVDIFICLPCEEDDVPEVVENVTVELTGKTDKKRRV